MQKIWNVQKGTQITLKIDTYTFRNDIGGLMIYSKLIKLKLNCSRY